MFMSVVVARTVTEQRPRVCHINVICNTLQYMRLKKSLKDGGFGIDLTQVSLHIVFQGPAVQS